MANDNTIKTFTAIDIEKYHTGQLSAREMHAMEKAALDDPFLADALEGYAVPGVNAAADIAELKKRLEERNSKNRVIPIAPAQRSSFPWLKAAAMIVLIAGAGYLTYRIGFDTTSSSIAKNTPEATIQKPGDSVFDKKAADTSTYGSIVNQSSNYTIPGNDMKVTDTTSGAKSTFSKEDKYYNRTSEEGAIAVMPDSIKDRSVTSTLTGTTRRLQHIPSANINAPVQEKKEIAAATTERAKSSVDNKSFGYQRDQAFYKATNADTTRYRKLSTDADGDGIPDKFDDEKQKGLVASAPKKKAIEGFIATENSQARHNIFRGRVTDANNNALPFANITNTVDNVGTYTDAKGNFTLISSDSVLNVQIRSVGFENNTRQIQSTQRDNQIVMQEDNRSLSEVIVNNNGKASNLNRSRNNTIVHEEPEPVDGWSNYDIYVSNNLKMPDTLQRMPSRRGEVELSFDVNRNGEPVNITVDKSLCESCDKEAIRLLKEGPKWKPKSNRRKRTSVTISF